MIERKIVTTVGEKPEFCCYELERHYNIRILKQLYSGKWYIEPPDEEYDYIYIKYCPFCGEPIYEQS